MRSLQVFNAENNPDLAWPPKNIMTQPLDVILKYMRGFAFKNLVNNKENSDVTLLLEKQPIYAHRALLAHRFPFLKKQFDPSKNHQEIVLEGVSPSLFCLLLEYMVF